MPRSFLLLVLAAACWGIGTVVSKRALDAIAPVTLLVVQLTVSVLLLLVLAHIRRRSPAEGPVDRRAMLLGLLNPGLSYTLALVGLSTIAASTSVLIWATEPLLIVVLAVVLLHEKLSPPLTVALAVALLGVVLVVFDGSVGGSWVGVALTVAAVLACALYTVLARIWAVGGTSVRVTLQQQMAALAFAVVLAAVLAAWGSGGLSGPLPLSEVPVDAWAAAVLSGAMYYALAFWLYLTALRAVEASVAGLFITLVPVFGVAAALVAGERLGARQWVGAVLVVGSVSASVLQQTRAPRRVLGLRAGGT